MSGVLERLLLCLSQLTERPVCFQESLPRNNSDERPTRLELGVHKTQFGKSFYAGHSTVGRGVFVCGFLCPYTARLPVVLG